MWSELWSPAHQWHQDVTGSAVAQLEALGVGAFWFPGRAGGAVFDCVDQLLSVTRRAFVGTGVLNVWMHDAADVAEARSHLVARHGDRLLLGLGSSHAHVVERSGLSYRRPLARLEAFLDELHRADPTLATDRVVLAALGPRMLELAACRTGGAHPYLTTPEHTERARAALGPDAVLAPVAKVVLDGDRDTAREHLAPYLSMPNYVASVRRCGFSEADLAGHGSDRLVDALVVTGDVSCIVGRIHEHLDAGANHVAVHAIAPTSIDAHRDMIDVARAFAEAA